MAFHSRRFLQFALSVFLTFPLFLNAGCRQPNNSPGSTSSAPPQTQSSLRPNQESKTARTRTDIGFTSRQKFIDHFNKHGAEFGSISKEEYLRQAQELRDRTAGGEILEVKRADEVITRFDRKTGAFLAFNSDLTIRTYFKPNDGENYFQRQSRRPVGRSGRNDNE